MLRESNQPEVFEVFFIFLLSNAHLSLKFSLWKHFSFDTVLRVELKTIQTQLVGSCRTNLPPVKQVDGRRKQASAPKCY